MTKKVVFVFDDRSILRCPTCKTPLKIVVRNIENKSGDYYCEQCPGNDRGKSGLRYFWNSELGIVDN